MALSRIPMYVEARVHYGLLQDEDAMSDLKRRVRDFICSQQTFSDGELPLTGGLDKHLVSLRVCGIRESAETETTNGKEGASVKVEKEEETTATPAAPKAVSFLHVDPRTCYYECEGDVEDDDAPTIPFSTVTKLPAAEQEGLWESLRYSTAIKPRLLSYLSSGAQFRKEGVHSCVITWHGVALLHGPPGTGKTSLCRALAQKLAIRTGSPESCYLVEVRADAVFSKFFSESARNVGCLFEAVGVLAASAGHVFVLLDEVESLASSRGASDESQPGDALRAVNALLTALDAARAVPNCTVLATSNLESKIDPAFLDRVDVHEYVPQPGVAARVEIIAECVQELSRVGIVRREGKPDKVAEELIREAAGAAKGLSGRALRKLPLLAHAAHVRGNKRDIPVACFLKALKAAAAKARKNVDTL